MITVVMNYVLILVKPRYVAIHSRRIFTYTCSLFHQEYTHTIRYDFIVLFVVYECYSSMHMQERYIILNTECIIYTTCYNTPALYTICKNSNSHTYPCVYEHVTHMLYMYAGNPGYKHT